MKYTAFIYRQPWIRIGAYQIGVIFGLFYYEWKNKSKNLIFENSYGTKLFQKVRYSRPFRYTLLIIGVIILTSLMAIPQAESTNINTPERFYPQIIASTYNAL